MPGLAVAAIVTVALPEASGRVKTRLESSLQTWRASPSSLPVNFTGKLVPGFPANGLTPVRVGGAANVSALCMKSKAAALLKTLRRPAAAAFELIQRAL